MELVLARIDSRLIHGQVIEAWVPFTHASCVVVANDEACGDEFQKTVMEMAVPSPLKLEVTSVEGCGRAITSDELSRERVLLLLADPKDAWRAFSSGLEAETINVGNMHYQAGKVQLLPSVFVGKEDIELFRSMEKKGVEVILRPLPGDKPRSLWALLGGSRQPAA